MSAAHSELTRLARKYERLIELRLEACERPPADLRSLAEEFPGALRELDALSLAELGRRLSSVRRALGGEPTEALIEWVLAYHELMRTSLAIKRRLRGERRLSTAQAELLAAALTAETGLPCSSELVSEVAAPPRGRLNEVVLARLSRTAGRGANELRSALFSHRVTP
jgi:hypothetical protein